MKPIVKSEITQMVRKMLDEAKGYKGIRGSKKVFIVSIIMGFQNSIEAPLFHLPVVAFHTNQKLWITITSSPGPIP